MNEIMNISGIECFEKDGTAYLKLETVAWGLGFTKTEVKNEKEYTSVRWERVFGFLKEINFDHKWAKDDFIPENIFYRLAMKAKNEAAERFQAKIADEVIPSIRKHGAYMTPETLEAAILNPDTMIKLCTALKDEQEKRKALEQQIESQKPAVLFTGAVETSKTSILIGELAKILKQNGINIGPNRLFEWMRQNGYLIKRKGTDYNMPTHRSMEMGLFEIKETAINNPDGSIRISKTPKVTGKGQVYYINLFLSKEEKPCQNSES